MRALRSSVGGPVFVQESVVELLVEALWCELRANVPFALICVMRIAVFGGAASVGRGDGVARHGFACGLSRHRAKRASAFALLPWAGNEKRPA